MGLKDIKPGTYRARAVGGSWNNVGAKETPAVAVNFEFTHEGKQETIQHVMYLTQTMCKNELTVAQNSFNTLATLGYNETNSLVEGVFTKEHLADKEVDIVIEMELAKDGKNYPRVKWVNELGGGRLAGVAIEKVLGNMNLKAEMAAARARMGASKPAAPTQKVAAPF